VPHLSGVFSKRMGWRAYLSPVQIDHDLAQRYNWATFESRGWAVSSASINRCWSVQSGGAGARP
jgi:hypothetical protein